MRTPGGPQGEAGRFRVGGCARLGEGRVGGKGRGGTEGPGAQREAALSRRNGASPPAGAPPLGASIIMRGPLPAGSCTSACPVLAVHQRRKKLGEESDRERAALGVCVRASRGAGRCRLGQGPPLQACSRRRETLRWAWLLPLERVCHTTSNVSRCGSPKAEERGCAREERSTVAGEGREEAVAGGGKAAKGGERGGPPSKLRRPGGPGPALSRRRFGVVRSRGGRGAACVVLPAAYRKRWPSRCDRSTRVWGKRRLGLGWGRGRRGGAAKRRTQAATQDKAPPRGRPARTPCTRRINRAATGTSPLLLQFLGPRTP